MEEVNNPFKKAGLVLVVIGVIDIGVMVYCISNKISYSSSFNIFAVIAGILLIKGGVKTARFIRWFSAFFVIAFTGMFLLMPISMPMDLFLTQLSLDPSSIIYSYLFGLIFIGVLAWVYTQLSTTESLFILAQAGYKTGKPKSALYVSIGLISLGAVLSVVINGSDSVANAKLLAEKKLGSNYKYHVSSFNTSGDRGSAIVTAYNSNEIRNIQVKW